ncbi:MAG: ABC transporter ATP-binding protein [Candidatus Thorarchaeota archaeon]
MTENESLFRLENLHRYYVNKAEIVKAIDGIDLTINSGEFVVILGPSGSGKTTLLNLLAGLDKTTTGSIYFNGQDVSQLSDSELCHIRQFDIGIIFQFYNMHPAFNVRENVEYPMLISKVPREKRRKRASNLLQRLGVYEKRESLPSELSGGEKQLVGIARALTNDPTVIIADEPTGNLDSENAASVIEILLTINREGKTIVMVTHDETLVKEEMRVLTLVNGKIRTHGADSTGP